MTDTPQIPSRKASDTEGARHSTDEGISCKTGQCLGAGGKGCCRLPKRSSLLKNLPAAFSSNQDKDIECARPFSGAPAEAISRPIRLALRMFMSTGTRRVTREELYALVWAKPMIRLAEEFGVSTTTLAQICARLDVPCPPRGHWIKKEFGKKLVTFELPPRTDDVLESAEIVAAPPRPAALQEAARSAAKAAERVAGVAVPDSMRSLHPRVMAWLAEHSEAQRRRREEARQHGRDSWYARVPVADLTERDQYRFRVTSAIFTALEKAGGGIEASPINGRVTFLIDGHKVDCSIAEKLVRSSRPRDEAHDWTAYPHWHSFGLTSSGFLRVTITHYSAGRQWIETDRKSMSDMLPGIVGGIMACGPILEQKQRERDEWHRQYREAEAIREAAERRK